MNELSVQGFIEFVNNQPEDKIIQNRDEDGIATYQYCAIGTYIKTSLDIKDEEWNQNYKKEYYGMCRVVKNKILSDYNSWIANKLELSSYNTYGELQQYLPMNI